jgi:hypothetical protein
VQSWQTKVRRCRPRCLKRRPHDLSCRRTKGNVVTASADKEVTVQGTADVDSSSNGIGAFDRDYNSSTVSGSSSNGNEGNTEQVKLEPWQWDESSDALKVALVQGLQGNSQWYGSPLDRLHSYANIVPTHVGIWRTLGAVRGWHAASPARLQHCGPALFHRFGSCHDLHRRPPRLEQQAAADYQP